jgi:hypothetical protein
VTLMTTETSSFEGTSSGWKPDWTPIDSCPGCGAIDLRRVFDGELMNFLCPRCLSCWHVELGFIHKVDPQRCPGCAYRLVCLEYQEHDPVRNDGLASERSVG